MTDVPPLGELQDWGREDWEEYDPCLWGGDPSTTRVLDTVIRAAAREMSWQGEQNANSLRDFWYNPTKPILQRAFPQKVEDPEFRFGRRMSQDLSRRLSEMVKKGEISYRSLNILDESRKRVIHTESPDDDKILFVEKEAAYRKLRPLEEVYELSVVSGGGWQATALLEDLSHQLRDDREYTVFLLTDYDPTGWSIGADFERRAQRLGVSVADVRRVGIHPDQLDPETVRQQRFTPAVESEADEQWMSEHGINGEYGLEIEALGDLQTKGGDLRRVVVDELSDEINVRKHMKRDSERVTENAAKNAVMGILNDVVDDLRGELLQTAAEVLAENDGVEAEPEPDDGEVTVEIEVDEVDTQWLPDPYSPERLHEAAVGGDTPGVKSNNQLPAKEIAPPTLREKVENEVDVAEFVTGIDSGGDGQ